MRCSPAFRSSALSNRGPSTHAGHWLEVKRRHSLYRVGGRPRARYAESTVPSGWETIRRALEKADCRGRSALGENRTMRDPELAARARPWR